MPAYQLHRLTHPAGDPEPIIAVFFADAAAMRFAMGSRFPEGCDVWEGARFVGRVHRPTQDRRADGDDAIG